MKSKIALAGIIILSIFNNMLLNDITAIRDNIDRIDTTISESDIDFPGIVQEVGLSVVLIQGESLNGTKWSGSGVVIDESGFILTAKHVISNSCKLDVFTPDGAVYSGAEWRSDPDDDIAIIKITALRNLPAVKFETGGYKIGEGVFIMGSPFGKAQFNSVNVGNISGASRSIPLFSDCGLLQLDIASNPGNSGSPVFNMRGKIIGVLVGSRCGADGVSFAIPVDACRKLIGDK